MKCFRLNFLDHHAGCLVSWHATRAKAEEALQERVEEHDGNENQGMVLEQSIPTDKAGLLRWLNTHFDTDNG